MGRTITVSVPQALLDTCLKIVQTLHDIRPWLKPAPLTMTSITNECLWLQDLLCQTRPIDRSIDDAEEKGSQMLRIMEAFILGCSMTLSVVDEYTMELYTAVEVAISKTTSPAPTSNIRLLWKEDDMRELLAQIRGYRDRLRCLLKTAEPPQEITAAGVTEDGVAVNQAVVASLLHRSRSSFLMRSTSSRSSLRESVVSLDPSPPYALSFHGDEDDVEAHFPQSDTAPSSTVSSQDVVALMDYLTSQHTIKNACDTETVVTLVRAAAETRDSFETMKAFINIEDPYDEPQSQPRQNPNLSNSSLVQNNIETRLNKFKRILNGLGVKKTADLQRIESMLIKLLDEVEDLRFTQQASVAKQTTHRQFQIDAMLDRSNGAIESGDEIEHEAQRSDKPLPYMQPRSDQISQTLPYVQPRSYQMSPAPLLTYPQGNVRFGMEEPASERRAFNVYRWRQGYSPQETGQNTAWTLSDNRSISPSPVRSGKLEPFSTPIFTNPEVPPPISREQSSGSEIYATAAGRNRHRHRDEAGASLAGVALGAMAAHATRRRRSSSRNTDSAGSQYQFPSGGLLFKAHNDGRHVTLRRLTEEEAAAEAARQQAGAETIPPVPVAAGPLLQTPELLL